MSHKRRRTAEPTAIVPIQAVENLRSPGGVTTALKFA
jgi:hypothetical protein